MFKKPKMGARPQKIATFAIFVVDRHRWMTARKTSSYIFSANNFRSVIVDSLTEHMVIMIDVLAITPANNGPAP